MIKLLVWADYACNTGFAQVSRNIVTNLMKTGDFEIDVIGINYDGDPYDQQKWPGNVYPALKAQMPQGPYSDVFGRQRVLDALGTGLYDACFMLQDTFVVKEVIRNLVETCDATGTRLVYYYPIDATPDPSWITDVVAKVHYPIAFTEYGKAETCKVVPELADKVRVIYHGTNTDDFHPLDEDRRKLRKQLLSGLDDDRFLLLNVNRNQPRKDILRSLLILKELKERGRNPFLYLHMAGQDVGGNILSWGQQLGLSYGDDYIFPENFGNGFDISVVNRLYNIADCVLMTTHGEGWGLTVTEAMSVGVPVVAPNCTSLTEILAENRGYLVPSGATWHDWYTLGHGDNNRLRPLMSVRGAADAIESVMDGDLPDVSAAYDWALDHTWEKLSSQFESVIREAATNKPTLGMTIDGQVVQLNRAQRRKMAKK